MNVGTLFILLLLLACPLMMVFMHRGGHGDHASHGDGQSHFHDAGDSVSDTDSLEELRQRRAALDVEIARLEEAESETRKAPAAA